MNEIKEGDVVMLASASTGPSMTVAKIKVGLAECLWFSGRDLKQAHIPVVALKKMKV